MLCDILCKYHTEFYSPEKLLPLLERISLALLSRETDDKNRLWMLQVFNILLPSILPNLYVKKAIPQDLMSDDKKTFAETGVLSNLMSNVRIVGNPSASLAVCYSENSDVLTYMVVLRKCHENGKKWLKMTKKGQNLAF